MSDVAAMKTQPDIVECLENIWTRFGAAVFWSFPKEFVVDPRHAHVVARELRHGSLDALRASQQLEEQLATCP